MNCRFFYKRRLRTSIKTVCKLLMFFFISSNLYAQNAEKKCSAESITPQSPNVASFSRYGQYPVDLSSGLVKINIPIYTIKTRQLELPITLSYHSSGIKVNDVSSSVGLGWTLNAGGILSIQVMGANNDEIGDSIKYNSPDEQELYSCTDDENFKNKLDNLCYIDDTQSDKYSYSVSGGISGNFVYDNKGALVQIPKSDNKIEYKNDVFIITSPNGTKYFFDRNICSKVSSPNFFLDHITAYYLAKIRSADAQDSIVFHYDLLPDNYDRVVDFTAYKRIQQSDNSISYYRLKSYSYFTYHDITLSKIEFNGGEVIFTAKNDRKDKGTSRLTNIQVNQTLISDSNIDKCIISCDLLNDDYFKSNGAISDSKYSNYFNRLKLSGINIRTCNGNESPQSYKFDYNQTSLPYYDYLGEDQPSYTKWDPLDNYAQDLWGYYNGKLNNPHLIPFDGNDRQDFTNITGSIYIPDRSVSEEDAKACSLEKISYPTGGYTLFESESNRLSNGTLAGGLRAKRIRSYNNNHELLEEKEYEYSGALDVSTNTYIPEASHYIRKDITLYDPKLKPDGSYELHPPQQEVLEDFVYTSSPFLFQVQYTNPVFYSEVTEYMGNKNLNSGKKIFVFDPENNLINGNPGYGSEYRHYTRYGIDRSWMRGDLLEEHIFKNVNGTFKEIQSKINKYADFNIERHICGLIVTNDINLTVECPHQESGARERYHWFNTRIDTGIKKLINSTTTEYNDGVAYQTKTINYVYDKISVADKSHQQITKEILYTSNGDEQTVRYIYPLDCEYSASNSADYISNKKLRNANVVDLPIEILKSIKHKGGDNLVIDGTFYRYQDINQLSEIYRLETKYPINYSGLSLISDKGYNISDKYNLEKAFSYDTDNNIKQIMNRNNIPQTFIWSYNSMYPIAEIQNATSDKVEMALNNINQSSALLLKNVNPDITKIDQLRKELPNSLISTYTYHPLRGLLSMTDPKGIKKTYSYDNWGRLKNVKEDDKCVKQYDYNLNSSSSNIVLYTERQYVQFRSATFNVEVKDGSGNYKYQWMLKNSAGDIIYTTENKQFSLLLTQKGILTLVCNVEDISLGTTKQISRAFNVVPPNMTASEISTDATEFRVNGKLVSFKINVNDGSLNYKYNWTLVTPTKTITGTSQNFSLAFEEIGNMKLTCVVSDIGLNQFVSKELSFVVNPPLPIEFNIGSSNPVALGSTIKFKAIIKDGTGSGNFTYNWMLKSPTKILTETNKEFTVIFSETGAHVINATVKDEFNGTTKTIEDSISVKCPIYFYDIKTSNSSGEYSLSAKIKCVKSTILTLELGTDRASLPSNNDISFYIAGKFYTLFSGTQNIKITLPEGENNLNFKYHKNIGSTSKENVWVKILNVSSDYAIIDPSQVKITAL